MRISVVIVKLKVFKVLRIDSASMNSLFWEDFGPKYGPALPKFSEVVL